MHLAPRRVIKDLPLTRLLPNMLTLMALCSGLTGVRYALNEHWQEAALAIFAAGIFDLLDGRVARLLNLTSKFGAELDSLADAISLGVSPAFIMYEWTLRDAGGIGWIAVLIYVVCIALRLARFNIMLEDPTTPLRKNYFVGMAAPGGAGLCILPLVLVLQFGDVLQPPPVAVAFWVMLLGGLMVSRLPTLSLKGIRVTHAMAVPVILTVVALIAGIITYPWLTIGGIGIFYFLSLPCGWVVYYRKKKREEAAENADGHTTANIKADPSGNANPSGNAHT
ncbi:MAG: CDP-diacylglycerol--serine O-phosphatidyltransferase [Pseudomonadota bacterium]|nr:CDP-diacylglycerol--serine O-phosphatidyltransferase [Pseudomonadota bacterium]